MERLTEKRHGQNVIPLRQDGKSKWVLSSCGIGNASTQFLYGDHADKLTEYEELEEQGKLLKLPCSTVWFICDKKTATVMPKSIEYLAVYEIDGIDKRGNYWSTRSKALAALEELGKR